MLRAKQIGFTVEELENITEGLLLDVICESANDHDGEYQEVASQADYDAF